MSLGSKRSFGLIDPISRRRAIFLLANLLGAEVLIADRAARPTLAASMAATVAVIRLAFVRAAILVILLGVFRITKASSQRVDIGSVLLCRSGAILLIAVGFYVFVSISDVHKPNGNLDEAAQRRSIVA